MSEAKDNSVTVNFKSSRFLFLILFLGVIVAFFAGLKNAPKSAPMPDPAIASASDENQFASIVATALPWLIVYLVVHFMVLRHSATKKVQLLAAFVAVGMALCMGLSSQQSPATPQNSNKTINEFLFVIAPWLLIFSLLYFLVYKKFSRLKPTDIQKYQEAIRESNAGFLDEAGKKFDELIALETNRNMNRVAFLVSRGDVYQRQGKIGEAMECFLEAGGIDDINKPAHSDVFALVWSHVAECHAIWDAIPDAESAIKKAEAHLRAQQRGFLVQPKAMLLLRRKNYDAARKFIAENFRWAESARTAGSNASLRLLWAFAETQLSSDRTAAEAQRLLAGLNPFTVGQFDYLAGQWPELKNFIVENNLCSTALASNPSPSSTIKN